MRALVLSFMAFIGIFLLQADIMAQSAPQQTTKPLSLRGRVESVEIKKIDDTSSLIRMKLRMELVNTGSRPIILLNREPLFPGAALAKNPADFETGNTLAWDYGGPANDTSPEWAALRSRLDQQSPPSNEIRILMPNESWPLDASVNILVPTDPSRYVSSRKNSSLQVIQRLSPVWLRVTCEVWPFNVEYPGRERMRFRFGHKLQRRWKNSGLLWLDAIHSEPIKIDLRNSS